MPRNQVDADNSCVQILRDRGLNVETAVQILRENVSSDARWWLATALEQWESDHRGREPEPPLGQPSEVVEWGTPITSFQAARAILRMIKTPIVDTRGDPGLVFERLFAEPVASMISSGEKRLRDIAKSVWNGNGADIGELGGIDRDLRRRVIVVLWYYFLGRDLPIDGFTQIEWAEVFA